MPAGTGSTKPLRTGEAQRLRQSAPRKRALSAKGANIVSAKDIMEWPYVALVVAILVMVAAAAHLLSPWVGYVIFGTLWVGFAIWSKSRR